jgi:hypothetical protein
MKTKKQEMALLGLQEINNSEINEVAGGALLNPNIVCCHDIPPVVESLF